MLAAVVETIVEAGLVMLSEGGAVPPGELDGGEDGEDGEFGVLPDCVCGACSVTEMVCVTMWLAASNAVIVMLLAPIVSGMEAMLHVAEPSALPICPLAVLQETCTGATPPEVVPEADTVDAVVVKVAAGLCTVSVRGAGAGCVGCDGCEGVEPGAAP